MGLGAEALPFQVVTYSWGGKALSGPTNPATPRKTKLHLDHVPARSFRTTEGERQGNAKQSDTSGSGSDFPFSAMYSVCSFGQIT